MPPDPLEGTVLCTMCLAPPSTIPGSTPEVIQPLGELSVKKNGYTLGKVDYESAGTVSEGHAGSIPY